jgi:hypothetical protein
MKTAEKASKIAELEANWITEKLLEEEHKALKEKHRAQLEELGVTIGYEGEHLKVEASGKVDLEDKTLQSTLRKLGVFTACHEQRLSVELIRARAKIMPPLARALEGATHDEPRWTAKKKTTSP